MKAPSEPTRAALFRIGIAGLPLVALAVFLFAVASDRLSTDWALEVDGNRYAANFVLAVATACSQLIVFVNLSFYLYDTRPPRGSAAASMLPEGQVGRGFYFALCVCWCAIGAYFLYVVVTLLGKGKEGYWLFSFDTFARVSRLVTVGLFTVFACVDGALAKAWRRVIAVQGPTTAAMRSRDLARFSMYLIDLPAIGVTVSSWLVVHFLSCSEFVTKVAEFDYLSGKVWAQLRRGEADLFINGIDTGVVVATMLLSQFTFAWLVWFFQEKASETEENDLAAVPLGQLSLQVAGTQVLGRLSEGSDGQA